MSQTQSTHDRVCAIVADICGIPIGSLDPGADLLVTLSFDELDYVELAVNLEDEFGIALTDGDMEACGTIPQTVALVERMRGVAE